MHAKYLVYFRFSLYSFKNNGWVSNRLDPIETLRFSAAWNQTSFFATTLGYREPFLNFWLNHQSGWLLNRLDPNMMPCYSASHLGPICLTIVQPRESAVVWLSLYIVSVSMVTVLSFQDWSTIPIVERRMDLKVCTIYIRLISYILRQCNYFYRTHILLIEHVQYVRLISLLYRWKLL